MEEREGEREGKVRMTRREEDTSSIHYFNTFIIRISFYQEKPASPPPPLLQALAFDPPYVLTVAYITRTRDSALLRHNIKKTYTGTTARYTA